MLVAMFVTAMLVTVVGTTIVPVPADSYVNRMALPRVEPPPEHARMVSSKEQSRMAAYAEPDAERNETRPVESSSNAPKTMEGGSSTYAKTSSEDHVDRAARGSPPPPEPEQPALSSDTKSADVATTGNANGASIATAESPAPYGDAAASSTAATSSAGSDCEQRNGRIGLHGFRPAHYRWHAHHHRHRGWHRTWASRRVIARSARGPGTYSSF
jgi:hypothetical protein